MPSPTLSLYRRLLDLTAAMVLCWLVAAAAIRVSPGEAADKPLAKAVAEAQNGDTLILAPGVSTYRQGRPLPGCEPGYLFQK